MMVMERRGAGICMLPENNREIINSGIRKSFILKENGKVTYNIYLLQ